jgi:aerobic-type carbon monoxide dehydrogenase small subunit (CoxS/CutS family)
VIELVVNGRPATVPAQAPLLDALRTVVGVRSMLRGCTDGGCGVCRVLVGGRVTRACAVTCAELGDGVEVETYEAVAGDAGVDRVLVAFEAERSTRCRLCVAGLGVTAAALGRGGRAPGAAVHADAGAPFDGDAVDAAVAGARCRCTGAGSLRRALRALGASG